MNYYKTNKYKFIYSAKNKEKMYNIRKKFIKIIKKVLFKQTAFNYVLHSFSMVAVVYQKTVWKYIQDASAHDKNV